MNNMERLSDEDSVNTERMMETSTSQSHRVPGRPPLSCDSSAILDDHEVTR